MSVRLGILSGGFRYGMQERTRRRAQMDRPQVSKPEADGDAFVAVTAPPSRDWGDDWVHESIEMTRPGIDFRLPDRLAYERQVPWEFDDFS
jgi:hypothetical protein